VDQDVHRYARADREHGMKVTVDWELCDGNGVCAVEAPTVFEIDDEDELHVLQEDVDGSDVALVQAAVRVCPKRAITLSS
jgi:ferredoxin